MTTNQFRTRLEEATAELGVLICSYYMGTVKEADGVKNLTREQVNKICEAEEAIWAVMREVKGE